jgi:hypothetical protein
MLFISQDKERQKEMKKIGTLIKALSNLGFTAIAQEISEKVLQEQLPEDIIPEQFSWIEQIGIKYKDMDSLDLFIQENWEQLEKINSFAKGKFKEIGGGYEGSAFQIGDGSMVLKIQEDFYYHPDPFKQGEEELEQLFGGKASPNQIMIYAHGELALPPDGEEYFPGGKRYWRIMEKVNVEDWQEDYGSDIQLAIEWEIISLMKKELERQGSEPDWIEQQFPEDAHYDIVAVRDAAIQLGCKDREDRKDITKEIAQNLRSSISFQIESAKEKQPDLPDDWLENYIEAALYELCEKGKLDLGEKNFGRRKNTGRFIWFDS